ncbi:MAG TPA: NAD(P)/FAD-dependent oxidoreductase [Actinomycetota bacterium]
MGDRFDVVVIGAGPPGENAAGRARSHGLSAAIVEERLVGGECSFYACIPSKTMLRPGDVLAAARRTPGAAEAITDPIDAAAALARRDEMTNGWDDGTQTPWLDSEGIVLVRGHGRLAGERTVEVETDDGTTTLVATRAVVLACGSVPVVPRIDGIEGVGAWDNRAATRTPSVPRRLVVLGGGPVGVELAQAFRRLGSGEVSVIQRGPRLLPHEEPFAGEELAAAFGSEGIRVLTDAHAAAVRRDADGAVVVSLEGREDLVGDELLLATGRRPHTDDVGLETVGLTPGAPLEVDGRLRAVGVDGGWLYGAGDVTSLAPFTHMGKYQGRLVGDAIVGRDVVDVADHRAVPRVTFTDPQVAAVGPTEAQARERGVAVRAVRTDIGALAGAYVRGEGIGGTAHLLIDDVRGVVVGATFTGPDVQEMLHAATIAVVGEVPLERLWHAVPTFPTVSEAWLRLLEAAGC